MQRTDPHGLYWFQHPWQSGNPVVGRESTIVLLGSQMSSLIERYVPGGRTLAEIHDPLIDCLIENGVHDILINAPTIIPADIDAVVLEIIRSLGYIPQPEPDHMCQSR